MPDITPKDLRPLYKRLSSLHRHRCSLEIGANDGLDTSLLLAADRQSHVHCFEPDPRAIERWRRNCRGSRSTLHEIALSDTTGEALFYPSGGNPGGQWQKYGQWDKSGSLLPFDRHKENAPWMEFPPPFTVKTMRLDDWARENIPPNTIVSLAWIDVQGAETKVLLGGLETLSRTAYVFCECDPRPNYTGQATRQDLINVLPSFRIIGEYGYNLLFENTVPLVVTTKRASTTVVSRPHSVPPAAATFQPTVLPRRVLPGQVSVSFSGELGEQMFQYVVGKILAEVSGLSYYPPTAFQSIRPWTDGELFIMEPTESSLVSPGAKRNDVAQHWIDWTAYKRSSEIQIRGGFQRYECLKDWKQRIRDNWLKPKLPPPESLDRTAVYAHCTGPASLPTAAHLSHFPDAKRLVLCTDDPNAPWLDGLGELGIPFAIHNGTWDQDLRVMLACRWLIISETTLAWWAGFLGQAEKVVCQLTHGSTWHKGSAVKGPPGRRPDQPNLIVDDEPNRWTWLGIETH